MWQLDKIPQVMHCYWGNDNMSFLRYLTVFSFRKLNPDWKIKLYQPRIKYEGNRTWTTPEQSIEFHGLNYIDKLKELDIETIEFDFESLGINSKMPETFKSDFLRWHLLSTQGGLWSDLDILYIRAMNDIYINDEPYQDLDTVLCIGKNLIHSIGFLMSSVNNPFFRKIYHKSHSNLYLKNYQSIGSILLTTNYSSLDIVKNSFEKLNPINLEMDVVYPLIHRQVNQIFKSQANYYTDKSIGIHWYAGHPIAGNFENTVTQENFNQYQGTFFRLIKELIHK